MPSFTSFEAWEGYELGRYILSPSELPAPWYSATLSATGEATRTLSSSFDSPHFSASNEPLSAQIRGVLAVLRTTTVSTLPGLSLGSIPARAKPIHLLKI
jgi:hypothetical protein